jgi:aspartyl-tRNA(Asn)/glutamyl-tRNA(Gln) amidotransferase subunit B
MRSKEEAHDYRYFPCPDLLPVRIEESYIEDIKKGLPELPDDRKRRLIDQYNISDYDSKVLTSDPDISTFFELAATGVNGKNVANLFLNELFGKLNKSNLHISQSPISSDQLNKICMLIDEGKISNKIAKDLFEILWTESGDPEELVERLGLIQVTDESALSSVVQKIMEENPDQVTKAKENPKLKSWFVGQAMKASKGKANPKTLSALVEKLLN